MTAGKPLNLLDFNFFVFKYRYNIRVVNDIQITIYKLLSAVPRDDQY